MSHPATEHLLSLFEYGHLPEHLQEVSSPMRATALSMVERLGEGPELTTGLRKLLEAKDCFVRQAVIDHREDTATPPTVEAATVCDVFKPMVHDNPNVCFTCGGARGAHGSTFDREFKQ